MAVSTYDTQEIINTIIQNLRLEPDIFDETGKNNSGDSIISTILFGDPYQQKWSSIPRPYIAIAPGEPFELSDEEIAVTKLGEDSAKSMITLQFFITCIVQAPLPDQALTLDLKFRKLLKAFFKNNPKMKDPMGDNPLFHKSRSIITPKFIRNKMDIDSGFTLILQAKIPSV